MKLRHLVFLAAFCALGTLAQAHDHDPGRALRDWSEDLEHQSEIDQITGAIDDLGNKLDDIERDLRHHQEDTDPD